MIQGAVSHTCPTASYIAWCKREITTLLRSRFAVACNVVTRQGREYTSLDHYAFFLGALVEIYTVRRKPTERVMRDGEAVELQVCERTRSVSDTNFFLTQVDSPTSTSAMPHYPRPMIFFDGNTVSFSRTEQNRDQPVSTAHTIT